MSLLNRRRQESGPANALIDPEALAEVIPLQEVEPGVDPYDFVANNLSSLDASAEQWTKIAQHAEVMRSPESIDIIKDGLNRVYENEGWALSESDKDVHARRIASEFSIYSILLARHITSVVNTSSIAASIGRVRQLVDGYHDDNIAFLIHSRRSPKHNLYTQATLMSGQMLTADTAAKKVMRNLAWTYAEQPEQLGRLAELYDEGIASTDPAFKELRNMVAYDWYLRDRGQSVLREFSSGLKFKPEAFIDGFSKQVEVAVHDKRLLQVKRMAEFAIAAYSNGENQPSISQVLQRSYPQWGNFDDIQTSFDIYVKQQTYEIEKAITAIAGPYKKHNIRADRTESEIREYQRTLGLLTAGRRSPAAPKPKHRSTHERALPSLDDIAEAVKDTTAELQPKRLFLLRNKGRTGNGNTVSAQEAGIDEIMDYFSLDKRNGLVQDVKVMLEELKVRPISKASSVLIIPGGKIVVDGNSIAARRFAPNICTNLPINPANRYHRIVYAFKGDCLYILDILDHASFDKKYSS